MPKQNLPKQNLPKQNLPKQNLPKQNLPKQNLPKQNLPKQKKPFALLQECLLEGDNAMSDKESDSYAQSRPTDDAVIPPTRRACGFPWGFLYEN